MGTLETWLSVLGLPIASGVNLYATVLVLGLGQRYGWITGLPGELQVLANPIVLGVAGALYVVEFFADKIPYVDTLWDGLHTVIRPLGAAYLAVQAVGDHGTGAQFLAMLVGAALGLGAHSTKAGTRLLVNTSPEPASNSIVSLIEDFGVVGLLVLIYTYPWVALGVVVVLIAAMALVTPLLFRLIRMLLGGVGGLLASWFGAPRESLEAIPDWVRRQLPPTRPAAEVRVFEGYARKVAGIPRFQKGYLVVSPAGLFFAFRTLFRSGVTALPVSALEFRPRLLFDLISAASGRAVVCVPKNESAAVQSALAAAPMPETSVAPAGQS
jgi:hypothetical protein